MASLEQHPTSNRFKICVRWGGQQFKKTVQPTNRNEAEAICIRQEENIGLVQRRRLQMPPEVDIATFQGQRKTSLSELEEIERQIARVGLTLAEEADLLDCLF